MRNAPVLVLLGAYILQVCGQSYVPRPPRPERQLMIGTELRKAVNVFTGVVMLNVTSRDSICTGVMIGPHLLLSAPACFPSDEAPPTASSNYNGVAKILRPYAVSSGAAGGRIIGYTTSHWYVYSSGQEGYRISAVNITRTDDPSVQDDIEIYPIYKLQPAPPALVYVAGYGPTNVSTVNGALVAPGMGSIEYTNTTLTTVGTNVRKIGKCSGFRTGGSVFLDRIARIASQYKRLCAQYGDLGAPIFLPDNGTLYLLGVLQDVDVYPCAVNKAVFTSMPHRQEWIEDKMRTLGGQDVEWEFCPSPSVTPSLTVTLTSSPSTSFTPVWNASYVPPPIIIPFPWWWVLTMSVGMLGLLSFFGAWCYLARRRRQQLSKVVPYDKAAMVKPHPEHVVSDLQIGDMYDQPDEPEVTARILDAVTKGMPSQTPEENTETVKQLLKESFAKTQEAMRTRKKSRFVPKRGVPGTFENRQREFLASTTVMQPRFNVTMGSVAAGTTTTVAHNLLPDIRDAPAATGGEKTNSSQSSEELQAAK